MNLMRVKRMFGVVACLVVASIAPQAFSAETVKTVVHKVEKKPIKRSASFMISRTVAPGRMVTHQKGKDGELRTTYQVTLINGKVVKKLPVKTERIQPVDDVILVGKPSTLTSRGSYRRTRVLEMSATGYDTSPQTLPGSSGRTATGIVARYGIVAVDPRVIKLGTFVYVEGYGFALAADTGGAIKGNKIDLCFNSRSEALAWGRRPVRVHILGD